MTYAPSKRLEKMPRALSRISEITLVMLMSFSIPAGLFRQWRQRVSDRRHLLGLNDHVLADFGLTRQEVIDEAAKPFWRPLNPRSER